jgi:NTP pyrophosphatase (non-canonical NTP hydrolase)
VKASILRPARARAVEAFDVHAKLAHALTFDALRAVNVPRRDRWHGQGSDPWTCADWSNALCGEAGELANVVKKIRRQQTGARNEGDPPMAVLELMAAAELADVVIYCDLLAAHFGVDLGAAVANKFNIVSKKFGFPERLGVRA